MNTEIVDVTDLEEGNQVKLFGRTYEVTNLTGKWANKRDLVLDETEGHDRLSLYDLESTPFVRVVPDPEEFRVRSVILPGSLHVDFLKATDGRIRVIITDDGDEVGLTADKADLKAVVEKL